MQEFEVVGKGSMLRNHSYNNVEQSGVIEGDVAHAGRATRREIRVRIYRRLATGRTGWKMNTAGSPSSHDHIRCPFTFFSLQFIVDEDGVG